MTLHLNRRHKTVSFLTLVAGGISLLFGARMRQTAGVVLLGLAAAWLLGGASVRAVWLSARVLAIAAGPCVAGLPVRRDFKAFGPVSNCYNSALHDLKLAVRQAKLRCNRGALGTIAIGTSRASSPLWMGRT